MTITTVKNDNAKNKNDNNHKNHAQINTTIKQ